MTAVTETCRLMPLYARLGAELARGHAESSAEYSGKIITVIKADSHRDFRNRKVAVAQQLHTVLNANAD